MNYTLIINIVNMINNINYAFFNSITIILFTNIPVFNKISTVNDTVIKSQNRL